MTKTISLLGSTGSIGRQTLQVARELGLSVAALTANRQVDLLEQQAREFHPALAVLYLSLIHIWLLSGGGADHLL